MKKILKLGSKTKIIPIENYYQLVVQHKKGKPFQPIYGSSDYEKCVERDIETFDNYYDSRILRSSDDVISMERALRDCNTSSGMEVKQIENLTGGPGAIFTTGQRRVVLVCSNGMVTKCQN